MPRRLHLLLFLVLGSVAQAQVYRCVDGDGTLIFSDRPCGAQAELHESGANLSIVPATQDAEQRLADHRALIEQQREQRQAQRRQAEIDAAAAQAASKDPGQASPIVQWLPFWLSHPPPPAAPRPPESGPTRAEERFSALSGRQPGSTRRDSYQDRNQ